MLKIIEDETKKINELKRQVLNKVIDSVNEKLKSFTFEDYDQALKNMMENKDYLFHFDFLESEFYTYSIVIGFDEVDGLYSCKIARIKTSDLDGELTYYKFKTYKDKREYPVTFYDEDKKDGYKWIKDQALWYTDTIVWESELDEL